jgi:hypothetical protein
MLQSNTPTIVTRAPQATNFSKKFNGGQLLNNNASQFLSNNKQSLSVRRLSGPKLGTNLGTTVPSVRQFKSTITVHNANSIISSGKPLALTAPMTPRSGGGGGKHANSRDHRDGAENPSPQGGVTVESIPGTARTNDVTGTGGSIIDQAIDGLLPDPYIHGSIGGTRDHRTGK